MIPIPFDSPLPIEATALLVTMALIVIGITIAGIIAGCRNKEP